MCSLFVAAAVSLAGECSCWDDRERHEVEGFSEIEGAVVLSFKDAVSCAPLAGADVRLSFPDKERSLRTGAKGYIVMPEEVVESMDEGTIGVTLSKEGYIPFKTFLPVEAGTIRHRRFLVSRKLPLSSVRFVLQWDEKPKDLDLHLIKDTTLHISYRHMRSIPDLARLDRDDMDGLGPETLTLDRIDKDASYRLFVHNYSGESSLAGSRVSVYANGKLDRVVTLPETAGRQADVLVIEGGTLR
ncbi:YfaP family protein [Desulfoluna spongiiphila]|uniref:YfaP family protein n=1 Tax=Desulfoluna spongiiphila TaxID=419481 RepID=UPI00111434A2|nr:hypothetical protein [Desulfoluna spongiiphila]